MGRKGKGKGFLFKLCVSQVKIILDSLSCRQVSEEAELLYMAES